MGKARKAQCTMMLTQLLIGEFAGDLDSAQALMLDTGLSAIIITIDK